MKKINYLFVMFLFTLFIPKVYALEYKLDILAENTMVNTGTLAEVFVSLSDVKGTDAGITSCSLNISFGDRLELYSKIETLNDWKLTTGKKYTFSVDKPITSEEKYEMFRIPVMVNGEGTIVLSNIYCTDGSETVEYRNEMIYFFVLDPEKVEDKEESSGLIDIIINEETIGFDSSVKEYIVDVEDFENLEINPVVENEFYNYTVDKNISEDGQSNIVITVTDLEGNSEVYTVYEREPSSDDNNDGGSIYIWIFVVVIVALVLINVFRIIKNKKKKL